MMNVAALKEAAARRKSITEGAKSAKIATALVQPKANRMTTVGYAAPLERSAKPIPAPTQNTGFVTGIEGQQAPAHGTRQLLPEHQMQPGTMQQNDMLNNAMMGRVMPDQMVEGNMPPDFLNRFAAWNARRQAPGSRRALPW